MDHALFRHGLKKGFHIQAVWGRGKNDLLIEPKGVGGLQRVWHGACNTWVKELDDSGDQSRDPNSIKYKEI